MPLRSNDLYAEAFGKGPDIVMLHGFGMHSGVWRDFAEGLSAQFRVTLIDLPGHGRSGSIDNFSLPGLSEALLALAPMRAHWIGWSLGASIALYAAWTNPARIASLIMIAGNAKFVQSETWPCGLKAERLASFAEDLLRDPQNALLRFLSLQMLSLPDARCALKVLRARLAECQPPDTAALRAGLAALGTADLRDVLRGVGCPAMFLLGGKDQLVPACAGTAMRALAPAAHLHIIPGAAHLPFYSHPQETVLAVTRFLHWHEKRALA